MTKSTKRLDSAKCGVLGRFEEICLLAAITCGPQTTAEMIRRKVDDKVDGKRSMQTILTTLDRLHGKGYIESAKEEQHSPQKGGRKRNIYSVTSTGVESAERSISIINQLANEAGLRKSA